MTLRKISLFALSLGLVVGLNQEVAAQSTTTNRSECLGKPLKRTKDKKAQLKRYFYTVCAGDNLYAIAKTYRTSVKELMQLNNLSTEYIQVGEKLLVRTKKWNPIEEKKAASPAPKTTKPAAATKPATTKPAAATGPVTTKPATQPTVKTTTKKVATPKTTTK